MSIYLPAGWAMNSFHDYFDIHMFEVLLYCNQTFMIAGNQHGQDSIPPRHSLETLFKLFK